MDLVDSELIEGANAWHDASERDSVSHFMMDCYYTCVMNASNE